MTMASRVREGKTAAWTDELADLFRHISYQPDYRTERINIFDLNILPQPRRTFEIVELALDIARNRMINLPTVAKFDRLACEQHLLVINTLWGTDYQRTDLRMVRNDGHETYYILLDGETRTRASLYLWETGCDDCRSSGPLEVGDYFRRHFRDGLYEVRCCLNIPPIRGLQIQFSANIHKNVPPHEEAIAMVQLFQVMQLADPDYTVGRFGRDIGKNRETIDRALLYCSLPAMVKKFVEVKKRKKKRRGWDVDPNELPKLKYGLAVEIARLIPHVRDDIDLVRWVEKALIGRFCVPDFRRMVSDHIDYLTSGQMDLFREMRLDEQETEHRQWCRQAVKHETVRGLWALLDYFRTVNHLFESGRLGQAQSPFSEASTLRLYQQTLEVMRATQIHLAILRRVQANPRTKRTIQKNLEHVQALLFGENDESPT